MRFILFLHCLMICFPQVSEARIRSSSCFVELMEESSPSVGDLVVLDVDHTLLESGHPALSSREVKRHLDTFLSLADWSNPAMKLVALDLVARKYCMQLIDPRVPQLLQELQERGVPVIVLSAMSVHDLGTGVLGPERRRQQLEEVGIFLSDPLHQVEPLFLEELSLVLGYYPAYQQGVLLSNGMKGKNSKGEVLMRFLERMERLPNRVIFVDDSLANVESVEKALVASHLFHEGWEFTGVKLSSEEVGREEFIAVWEPIAKEATAIVERYFSILK